MSVRFLSFSRVEVLSLCCSLCLSSSLRRFLFSDSSRERGVKGRANEDADDEDEDEEEIATIRWQCHSQRKIRNPNQESSVLPLVALLLLQSLSLSQCRLARLLFCSFRVVVILLPFIRAASFCSLSLARSLTRSLPSFFSRSLFHCFQCGAAAFRPLACFCLSALALCVCECCPLQF